MLIPKLTQDELLAAQAALRSLAFSRFRVLLRLEAEHSFHHIPLQALRGGLGYHLHQLHCTEAAQAACSHCSRLAAQEEETAEDEDALPPVLVLRRKSVDEQSEEEQEGKKRKEAGVEKKDGAQEEKEQDASVEIEAKKARFDCEYLRLFHPVDERGQALPAPFLLSAPFSMPRLARDQIAFDLTLIGEARFALPSYLSALMRMGDPSLKLTQRLSNKSKKPEPFGLGSQQLSFLVESIRPINAKGHLEGDCVKEGILLQPHGIELSFASWSQEIPAMRQLTVEIRSPLQLEAPSHRYQRPHAKGQERVFLHYLTLDDLFQQICRRLANLLRHPAWSGEPLWEILDPPPRLHFLEAQYRWHEAAKAHRSQQSLNLNGLMGSVSFRGTPGALWPFLQLGQFLHIGRRTAYGNGQFQLIASSK